MGRCTYTIYSETWSLLDIQRLGHCLQGPAGTAYEGHTYKLSLKFPHDYPFKAPTVKFETLCWHPNVEDGTGTICLDILKARQIAAVGLCS